MMERRVLDKLEARRMVLVGSWICGRMEKNMLVISSSFHLQYQTEKRRKKKHTIPLPPPFPQTSPTTAKIPFNTTIPTEVPTKVCNPRISK